MAVLTIKRIPVKKYAMQAGDYELWINNSYYAALPNNDLPVSFNLSSGSYKIQIKKSPFMSSTILELSLSESENLKLLTGNAINPSSSFTAAMLGSTLCFTFQKQINNFVKTHDNILYALLIIFLAAIISIGDMKLRKVIFLKVDREDSA